jgi:hypothetical protein
MAGNNIISSLAQSGVCNDATRQLEGGFWQNVVEEGEQGPGSAGAVVADLQSVGAILHR